MQILCLNAGTSVVDVWLAVALGGISDLCAVWWLL